MNIANTLSVSESQLSGLLVFSANSNVWVYGYATTGNRPILIALDTSFTVLVSYRYTAGTGRYRAATTDGAGHAYFAGTEGTNSQASRLVKYSESTLDIVWQKTYSHTSSTSMRLRRMSRL